MDGQAIIDQLLEEAPGCPVCGKKMTAGSYYVSTNELKSIPNPIFESKTYKCPECKCQREFSSR